MLSLLCAAISFWIWNSFCSMNETNIYEKVVLQIFSTSGYIHWDLLNLSSFFKFLVINWLNNQLNEQCIGKLPSTHNATVSWRSSNSRAIHNRSSYKDLPNGKPMYTDHQQVKWYLVICRLYHVYGKKKILAEQLFAHCSLKVN